MSFWDSSAIVPLCVNEDRSQAALRLWRSFSERYVWRETSVEVESVFARLNREGVFDAIQLRKAQSRFLLVEKEWSFVERSDLSIELARTFPVTYGLKALDCLQLAAALVWCKEFPKNKDFVSADTRLSKAAESAGFTVHYLV